MVLDLGLVDFNFGHPTVCPVLFGQMGIWQEAGQDGGTLKSKSTQPRTTTTRAGSACKILEVLSHQRKNFSRAPMTNLLVVSMAQLGTTDARLYSSWAPTAIDARLV